MSIPRIFRCGGGARACVGLACALCLLPTALLPPASAAERQGAYIAEIEDEDGDLVIAMETDWISMHLMPAIASTVVRFVFRPTQNEIVDATQPKNLKAGGGLLQDNVWEQDWRFQELRGKWYDYQITKTGPDGREWENSPWWTPTQFYYMGLGIQRENVHPSFIVDITDTYVKKMEVLSCYQSQFSVNLDNLPRDDHWGPLIGASYGEAFYSKNPLGIDDLLGLKTYS